MCYGIQMARSSTKAPTVSAAGNGDAAPPRLDDERVLEAYRRMLFARLSDERAFSLQRQGRLGTFSPVRGQEASVVGSAMALDPARDWIVPQYRELPAMMRNGYSLESFLLYFMGSPLGGRIPDGVNVLPFQISLAAQIPHAVGLAWGLKRQGKDGVVLVYFGDGASSEGDAHEAMNLAGVVGAPVVFVLQNNGWAITTPTRLQTAAETFAARAAGYGFAGELVDGCDVHAVHDATSRAVERARRGEGPTLIESRAYRLGPHNTTDDPTQYVDADELARHEQLDPLVRLRAELTERGLLDAAADEQHAAELKAEINLAVTAAEAGAIAQPEQIFEHVYADPPERVRRQRARLMLEQVDG
jgi:pyruvate dehydrogenase E1 component alpha subunit